MYDEDGLLRSLSREDSKKFLYLRDRELRRRIEGVWFMNNGELTYLTGGHYFSLQWGAMAGFINEHDGSSYGYYRKFQADVGYFLQMCKQERECLGGFIIKPKKTGVTQFLALDFLDEATRHRGRVFGIMSKAQVPDCRDTNFMYFLHAYDNLPNCMKPSESNRNLTSIIFGKPKVRQTGSAASILKQIGNAEGLDTRVFAAPTKANAFDGPKMFRAWLDEFPKYEAPYPDEVWKKTQETPKMQSEIMGKLWISSYTPEDDSRGYKEAKQIYYDSKLKTKGKTNRTKTELYTYFINSLDSSEGTFDKYGRGDRHKTKVYIDGKRDQYKNDKAQLQAYVRQYPITEEEAWRAGGGGGSVWDNVRLGARLNDVNEALRLEDVPFIEGEFKWLGKEYESPIHFVELTDADRLKGSEAPFRIYHPEWLKQYKYNVPVMEGIRGRNKLLKPKIDTPFIASLDPTNYAMKKHVLSGSKNSGWVFNFPDAAIDTYYGRKVTRRPVCEYYFRREKPSDTYRDIVMMVFYFGCYILIEGNMPWVIAKMVEDGLENFLLVREKSGAIVPYDTNEHQTLVTSTRSGATDTIDEYIRAISNYIAEPESEDDFDYLTLMESERFLSQAMEFDPTETKKFDAVVGVGWGVVAMNAFLALRKKMAEKDKRYDKHVMEVLKNEFLEL
jgi:hypothetical protein